MKKTTLVYGILGILIIGLASYFLFKNDTATPLVSTKPTNTATTTATSTKPTTQTTPTIDKTKTVIGLSVGKRDITAYHYGTGENEILFVGGIHGGYEWNTVLLAYELMDYLTSNPTTIPSNVKVTIIPVLNPDGLNSVTGSAGRFSPSDVSTSQSTLISGRFNANSVDLSRNFDCNWKSKGVWQTKTVSGGSKVFSEPESIAIKNYVESHKLSASVVWYSAAGGVYASSCNDRVSPETMKITNAYAKASGYPAFDSFDFYETAGDMVNWLASENIPAISVLLTNHKDTEWTKNLAGVKALINYYAK